MSMQLTPAQHSTLKEKLERQEQALAAQLSAHLHGQTRTERARELLAQDGDDAPQRAPELAMAAALTDREQRELEAVRGALGRLARGAYGRCPDCGEGIPFDRLEAEPWAERCVSCASALELSRH
jgi:DnaK suppressor protein